MYIQYFNKLILNNNKILNNYNIYSFKSKKKINSKFLEWFVDFSDGESSFSIYKDKSYIKHRFIINLHINDLETLTIIKNTLEIGNVNSYTNNNKNYCSFTVYDLNQIYF